MNSSKIILLFIVSVVLTSCVFTEEVYINTNGSGRYIFSMDMSEMMESMKDMSAKDSLQDAKVLDTVIYFKDILEEQKDSIAKLTVEEKEVLETLKDFTMRMQVDEEKGKMLMNFGLDFSHISDLKNMSEKIAKAQSLSDKKSTANSVPFNNDTEYTFDGTTFKRKVKLKKLSQEKAAEFNKMMTQSTAFMEGSTYKIIYHFEKRIKSVSVQEASISKDQRTVTIEMPMDSVMKNPRLLDFEITLKKR